MPRTGERAEGEDFQDHPCNILQAAKNKGAWVGQESRERAEQSAQSFYGP